MKIEQEPPIIRTYTIFDSLEMLTRQESKYTLQKQINKKANEKNIVLI